MTAHNPPTTRRLKAKVINSLAQVRERIRVIEEALEVEHNPERRAQLIEELEELERPFDEGELEERPSPD